MLFFQEYDQLIEQQKEIEEKISDLEANPPRYIMFLYLVLIIKLIIALCIHINVQFFHIIEQDKGKFDNGKNI